ncbi:MAG: terminase gpA endonuclease subunit [Halospina sp.]
MTLLTKHAESSAWTEPVRVFFEDLSPRELRSMRQFAEDEVYLTDGPRGSMRFRVSFMPWTGLVLDEMDNPRWRRFFARGPVQSGKTILFVVIPTLYHLFEVEENLIFSAPTADMAWDIFKTRVKPAIKKTRYGDLWPRKGPGSRGGKTNVLRFRNGVSVRFMGAGGGDEQRSSFTARVVVMTELDKMDTAGDVSRETNPVSQLAARTEAFGVNALIYGECTTTQEEGRIFQETMVQGSGHRVHIRCPHCEGYLYPIRENLTGWRIADNEIEAGDNTGYMCQLCEVIWTEQDRQEALRHPLLVPKDMKVEPDGTVTGEEPQTYTFGLVWNWLHSGMKNLSEGGVKEWKAERSSNPDDEREVCQFWWARPHQNTLRSRELSFGFLAQHCHDHVHFDPLCATVGREEEPPQLLPDGAEWFTGAIDVQKRMLYYLVDGWNTDLTRWSLAWGVTEIVPEGAAWDPSETHIRQALDATLAILNAYDVLTTWVDTGYKHEGAVKHVVRQWCAAQGDSVHALVGRSETQMRERMTGAKMDLPEGAPDMLQARLQDDGTVLWFLEVDTLADELYHRLFREFGSPGYHHFAREAANERRTDRSKGPGSLGWLLAHFMRVKRKMVQRGLREKREWHKRGRHDMFDCAVYSLGGAMVTLADIEERENDKPHKPKTQQEEAAQSSIRTHY